MRYFSVSLEDVYPLQGGELSCMLAECPMDVPQPDWKRPAVIVVPGGAYYTCSNREKQPIANAFFGRGFQAFILTYKCAPENARYPEQLLELAAAVDYVRKNAEAFCVDPKEVFVVGFSAGGHLTANLAADYAYVNEIFSVPLDCRPTAVGLSYPVITTKTGYRDSHDNLLSGYTQEEKAQLMPRTELDELVTAQTAPAFIWSTAEDTIVPAENAMRFATALARNGVQYELHVYPQGNHGLSDCSAETNPGCGAYLKKNAQWLDNCASFFRLFCDKAFYPL